MLFSSLVFLWFFLPAVLLSRWFPLRVQNAVLLAASLLFYAWGEPKYILLMLVSITVNWAGGIAIDRCAGAGARRAALAVTLAVNLGLLGYFKYYGFAADTLAALAHRQVLPLRDIALPIGISFYTFQAMSYIIDLYRKKIGVQRSWFLLALYISLFPQLIAGPIVQYSLIEQQLTQRRSDADDLAYGIKRFLYGLSKKVILSNAFAARADEIFGLAPGAASWRVVLLGALLYGLQMYYDFSGYSDMAIGLGRMFGFTFPENFRYPFLADSLTEFWRRWHLTMSGWFREYLFFPLGGSRRGEMRTLINLMIVFSMTGLWHGASWQYVIWGAYFGVMQILERAAGRRIAYHPPAVIRHLYVMALLAVSFIIFRAPGLNAGLLMVRTMFTLAPGNPAYPAMRYLDGRLALLLAAGTLLCGPLQKLCPRLKKALYDTHAPGPLQSAALLALGFWCTVLLVSGTYNPFIYFRF